MFMSQPFQPSRQPSRSMSCASGSRRFLSRAALAVGALALAAPLAAAPAGDDKPLSPQQKKMSTCSKEARGKSGDERRAFMKKCLSAKADSKPDSKPSKG